jgi:aminoglycoside N3'-acetyltransferase
MIHVAEEAEDVPYLYRTRVQTIVDGERSYEVVVRRPGRSNGFYKIDPHLRARSVIIDGKVGEADCMLMRAAEIVDTARELLRNDLTALLCDDPSCESCNESRQLIAHARST